MSEISLLAIALGGACGSVSRFLVAREMGRRLGDFLPYGTLAVNVLGSLALGWLATVFLDRPEINSALRLGIAVGFLGAFTTFSTFSLESVQLLLNGAVWRAMLNIAVNTVVCLGMCYLGMQ
ncbi:MAG: fluoride efflux transporter CrcB, partial [SAR324 cluster bacterium]|nr:fluoride efflux transporter CrcB [SAR324 cluster bacterium]